MSARTTRVTVEVVSRGGGPPPISTAELQPCAKEYATFEYGTGIEYGSSALCPEILEIDTPARDLILVKLTQQAVVDGNYLDLDNYTFTDLSTNSEQNIRRILRPFNSIVTIDQILIVVDKHIAGTEYNLEIRNLISRDGRLQESINGDFFARDAKANAMLGVVPNHFNADPQKSTMRHVIQAIAQADDEIGGL